MTSKLTREENIQAVFDLKAGYTLGLADVEILKRVARMALAAMDSEPVAEVYQPQNVGICAALGPSVRMLCALEPGQKLYRHAQPAPELRPVGYLFVSNQGAVAYSPTNWGMPGFRLICQIYGDMNVELQPIPVVTEDVRQALSKMDDEIIAELDAEEIACRAAMLAAAQQEGK